MKIIENDLRPFEATSIPYCLVSVGEGSGKYVSDVTNLSSWGPQAETTQGLGV